MQRHNVLLTVTSLLSILLFSIHITDDIVRGFDSWGFQSLFGVLILVVWLYGALVLTERRSGLIIMLVGGVLAAVMPVIHSGAGKVAKSSGGFFFIWTLFAIGATGTLSVIFAIHGLQHASTRAIAVTAESRQDDGGSHS